MIAIYTRQSIDKQDSISIETQISFCKKEILDGNEFKIYEDKGFSGRNIERPAFKKMLKDVEERLIDKIIVYKLDRISRSITDFSNIVEILEKNNVSFISASEKFDTSTPTGRAMLYIIMIFAQLERETIAERIKDNYYSRGKTGVWLGGKAPMGFKNKKIQVNGKKISTIEETEDIEKIKEIFDLYANSNLSLGGISKYLLNKYSENIWNNVKLSRIIHNPVYVKANIDVYDFYKEKGCIITNDICDFIGDRGCILYGKRERGTNKYKDYKDTVLSLSNHKGVIESEVWLKCQEKLKNNIQIKNTGKGKHSYLTGLIKCGYCGYSMNVKKYKDKKYFNCGGRYVTNLCIDKIKTHYVEEVEEYILKEIKRIVDKFPTLKIEKNKNQNKLNELKIELYKVEENIEKLINNLNNSNEILLKYANEKIIELDTKKNVLLNLITEKNLTSKTLEIPNLSNWENLELDVKKNIVTKLIDRVEIFNDMIKINWNC